MISKGEKIKLLWQDPVYRAKQSEARKKAYSRPEVKAKKRQIAYERGLPGWSKGLTKETSPSIAKLAQSLVHFFSRNPSSEETNRKRSDSRKNYYNAHPEAREVARQQFYERGLPFWWLGKSKENTPALAEAAVKKSQSLKGHPTSEGTRKKIADALKGKKLTKEHRCNLASGQQAYLARLKEEGKPHHNKGRRRPDMEGENNCAKRPEVKEKISQALKGRQMSPEWIKKIQNRLAELWQDPTYKGRMIEILRSPRRRQQNAEFLSKLWASKHIEMVEIARQRQQKFANTPEGKEACRKGAKAALKVRYKPNYPEQQLLNILELHFPNQWKFVGNGEVWLGNRNPDFLNTDGRKIVIELFGTHWHDLFDVARRTEHYKQYGFACLCFWSDEISNEESIVKRCKKALREARKKSEKLGWEDESSNLLVSPEGS